MKYGLNIDEAITAIKKNYPPENYSVLREALDMAMESLEQDMPDKIEHHSDGYHTFSDLYHQRAILFASLCRLSKGRAWRSRKHHDGSMFGDNWFIVGINTPEGQYTYHYEVKYWPVFESCETLDFAPEWDGHTDRDVDRLLSLGY